MPNVKTRIKTDIDDLRPVREAEFAVIDTELTGLNARKDSIVSLGAFRMIGSRILVGAPFYLLVKPRTALTKESVIIHGITPSEVAEERDSAPVLSEFVNFCGSGILVGHCVGIDLEFINSEWKRVHGGCLRNPALDTARLYCWLAKRGFRHRRSRAAPEEPELYALAASLEIEVSQKHNALTDAFITAQLFQRFLPLLGNEGVSTIGRLLAIGDPAASGDWWSSGEIGSL